MADRIEEESVDLGKLNQMIEEGMVRAQRHNMLPLTIYKYTQKAVYTGTWNETTLRCRGLVLDDEGTIVVNGFTKFFNHSEREGLPIYESHKDKPYVVTEKLDGSLIQAVIYKDWVLVTSSGSFDSPQAAMGRECLLGKENRTGHHGIKPGITYLFEIIYPGNRIVLDYGNRQSLVLLAMRDTATGEELDVELDTEFEHVQPVSMTLYEIEQELGRADFISKEGYVVTWEGGIRVKMKYAEYMRLHKIVSGVNEKFVWEALRDGVDLEAVLKGVPDELFKFVQDTATALRAAYKATAERALAVRDSVVLLPTRKEQAAVVMKDHKDISALVFCLLDGKNLWGKTWKMIEPENKKELPDEG